MNNIKQFEHLKVSDLREMTETYEELERENKILRAKFPTKLKADEYTAEKLLEELSNEEAEENKK